ncbi:SLC13 family permease [Pseudarthrobacter sp. PS3-L1]|uniref:SLC13 family permease n=1 Tax=Pseudarthrobacter sp. PS3-L1 TaxID=3046207 RepID=UPI0024B9B7E9|nr:SLC13 family permease [Pseudarthrobacter sp. PS3-L1]MDJ0319130.1 SLC13 family permease [Pseudarthrobacter sp. PS3-L1]
MSDITITLVVLVLAVAAFVWNRIPVSIVALGVALLLYGTGIVSLDETFAGFGSGTVVLIAALFVVAEAIDNAGVTTWLGTLLIRYSGTSRFRLMSLMMALTAVLTAFISVNGAVAALLPMVVVLAVRLGRRPAQLLMPLAFAAHAGSLLVLTGSPVNILILEAAMSSGGGGIGFFEFGLVGLPLLLGTIALTMWLAPTLLPNRTPLSAPKDLGSHGQTLMRDYMGDDGLRRLGITAGSTLVGRSVQDLLDVGTARLHLISVQGPDGRPSNRPDLSAGDQVVVRGEQESINEFADRHGITEIPGANCGLISSDYGVAEVVVAPRSNLVGTDVYPGMVTESGTLVILAHQHAGEAESTIRTKIAAGDRLLLQGTWRALDQHTIDHNVLLVDSPDAIRRQTVPLGPGARPALVVLGLMVVLLATNIIPAPVAALLAAIAMVLLRVITSQQAQRSMSWQTLILVAGMIPLSTAITSTGTATMIADAMVAVVGTSSPVLLLAGFFVITAVLGQLISNTATALIIILIGIAVAAESGINPLTVLMCISVASAAALLTPVATPANMMIMEPAGYRFGDYWKFGLAIMALYAVVSIGLVPLIWPP